MYGCGAFDTHCECGAAERRRGERCARVLCAVLRFSPSLSAGAALDVRTVHLRVRLCLQSKPRASAPNESILRLGRLAQIDFKNDLDGVCTPLNRRGGVEWTYKAMAYVCVYCLAFVWATKKATLLHSSPQRRRRRRGKRRAQQQQLRTAAFSQRGGFSCLPISDQQAPHLNPASRSASTPPKQQQVRSYTFKGACVI